MTVYLPEGPGESLGDSLATNTGLIVSGNIWYVNSVTGTDAAAPAGKNREKPLATLAQALTNAADQDIIVCQAGHTQTVTSTMSVSKKVVIVGAGSGSTRPKFTINSASSSLFNIITDHVELRNLWIEENAQANSVQKINVDATGTDFKMIGCYLEANGNDDDAILVVDTGAHRCQLVNCTFISTSTTTTTQPHSAILSGGAVSNLEIVGCTVSDGTVGWSNIWGVDLSVAAVTGLHVESLSLLLGAEWINHASTTGFMGIPTRTGGGKVSW
jgi:hypothetical protein